MNILDKIAEILDIQNVKKGFMPAAPDDVIGLFEYFAAPPQHHFSGTDIIQNVQVRTRGSTAYADAEEVTLKLNRYSDSDVSIIQSTPILDIGYDDSLRQEYTVNFEIRRY